MHKLNFLNVSRVSALFTFLAVFICSGVLSAFAHNRVLSEQDNGQTINMPRGAKFVASLPGNPTTGYSWTLQSISGKAVIQDGKIAYNAGANPKKLVGSGGTFSAPFRAIESGDSTISMQYVRPWEKGQQPARTFTAKIHVN